MKQFDLTTYNRLVAEGKTPKIVTRNGHDVRIICTDRTDEYPIIALEKDRAEEIIRFYHVDGTHCDGDTSTCDLFFADLEPRYRPYANAKEFLDAQKEHGMYIVINNQNYIPTYVEDKFFKIPCLTKDVLYHYDQLLDKFRWQDGSPCGVKEE